MYGQNDVEIAVLVDSGREVSPQLESLLVVVFAVGDEAEFLFRVELLLPATESLELEHRNTLAEITNLGGERERERERMRYM